jgi:hypothetical protein
MGNARERICGSKMNNRWLVKLFEKQLFKNAATRGFEINPTNWLNGIDNASSWLGYWYDDSNHWSDTHIYTWKQIHERALELYRKSEERRKKYLESDED